MTSYQKLARILRTEPKVLENFARKMDAKTGKTGIIENIVEENEILTKRTLDELGLNEQARFSGRVYETLVNRLRRMDLRLYNFLDKPDITKMSSACGKLCEVAEQLAQTRRGFFIKRERAVKLLEKFPPQNLLDHFGDASVRELVDKRGFSSVFASLRFAQDTAWMHKFFEDSYKELTPDDFEERDVELKVLEPEWLEVAEKFMKKKYHNVSHLKELGIIFIVPLKLDVAGETSRMFTLLLHYLNEVPFYSKLFRKFAGMPDFIPKIQSLLRGDVLEGKIQNPRLTDEQTNDKLQIRIVQRYLAKDDENDFRLLEPHVNPEAEHWYKAESDLEKIDGFGGWRELDFVGDFFPSADGSEKLVSFDLIDLIMSLVKKGEIKYLYHQQEALWNKIFVNYIGRDKMNELIDEHIVDGFFTL